MSWLWTDYATQDFLREQHPEKGPGRKGRAAMSPAPRPDQPGLLKLILVWSGMAVVSGCMWAALIWIIYQLSGSA